MVPLLAQPATVRIVMMATSLRQATLFEVCLQVYGMNCFMLNPASIIVVCTYLERFPAMPPHVGSLLCQTLLGLPPSRYALSGACTTQLLYFILIKCQYERVTGRVVCFEFVGATQCAAVCSPVYVPRLIWPSACSLWPVASRNKHAVHLFSLPTLVGGPPLFHVV